MIGAIVYLSSSASVIVVYLSILYKKTKREVHFHKCVNFTCLKFRFSQQLYIIYNNTILKHCNIYKHTLGILFINLIKIYTIQLKKLLAFHIHIYSISIYLYVHIYVKKTLVNKMGFYTFLLSDIHHLAYTYLRLFIM